MAKTDIEKESLVTEEDILKIEEEIEKCKKNSNFINDESTPISIQKQTLSNLVRICYLELYRDRYKTIYNYQKKDDHGFYSIKSANEELQKISNSTNLTHKLLYLIDFSYYNFNSINSEILNDMKKNNYIVKYILNEIPNDSYYKRIIDLLKKLDKNFNSNCKEIVDSETNKLDKELKEIKETNHDLMTKHIISKNIFDMVKEYIDMINSKRNNIEEDKELVESVSYEFATPEGNEYYEKIQRLNNIEYNFNNIDEKYKKAIKHHDIEESMKLLEKLKTLLVIKKYITLLNNKQKNILRSLSKNKLFYAYMNYMKEIVNEIDSAIAIGKEELSNNNINEYIDLFDLINSLITYDKEIKSYEDKIAKTNVDTEIISYNNKITAFTIKKRRVDISLLKNRFFDSSLIDNTVEISKSNEKTFDLKSNIDDEIRKCNEELSKCFEKLDNKELIDILYTEYINNKLENTIEFSEYLIIKNNYMGAKVCVLKNKLLDLVYSKYLQSEMNISFIEYIQSNPVLNLESIIKDYEVIEFEKSKVKCKTKEKNI